MGENRWCPGPESNRHASRRGILSPLRLPISPPGHGREDQDYATVLLTGLAGGVSQLAVAQLCMAIIKNTKVMIRKMKKPATSL